MSHGMLASTTGAFAFRAGALSSIISVHHPSSPFHCMGWCTALDA